jgi:hypothetical protein
MSHRRTQVIDAVAIAAAEAGASVQFKHRTTGHFYAELKLNGRTGKIFLSNSPSDGNAYKSARKDAERKLEELRKCKS